MNPASLSVRPDTAALHAELRGEYLAHLTGPLDDMWGTFAELAAPFGLFVDGEAAGMCCVDDQGQILRFWVRPRFLPHADPLLRLVLTESGASSMVVSTVDPVFLSAAIDVAQTTESHSLLFAHLVDPQVPGLEEMVPATPADLHRLVEWEIAVLGSPREFLEAYLGARLERGEILVSEYDGEPAAVGELRRDPYQRGIAHLGVIVDTAHRGRGLGSQVLVHLVERARREGLAPFCSTEMTNAPARRIIERAGFRAQHRVLRITAQAPADA